MIGNNFGRILKSAGLSWKSFSKVSLRLCISATIFAVAVSAQPVAPGGPGKDAQWATAAKQGVGTSATTTSKVWFTLAQGVMTEAYYPDVTVANVHLLQFVVVNPKTKKVETEQDDAYHQIRVTRPDSLTFQQINTAKSGAWKITKTYVTDPTDDAVLIDVQFECNNEDIELYVYFDPSISNSGMKDYGTGINVSHGNFNGFEAAEISSDVRSLVLFSVPISDFRSSYANDRIDTHFFNNNQRANRKEAGPGNVVQIARIAEPGRFTAILSFDRKPGGIPNLNMIDGSTGKFTKEFSAVRAEYEEGWADYVKTLPRADPKYQAQFNMAAMQLKAHEDKANPGANIASMSVPWGGGANANEPNVGGYHLVWSRDLYQVFTAFLAIGDKTAAERALDFLFKVQQKPDGSFPQNSWLDGRPFWGSLQMDEVAYPLIMAYQIGRFDKATWENHVKKAADFIVRNGPATPQERWEEESGYSPSTIAAEIAGLVCAAEIAKRNGDEASALIYLAAADDWARNVERWTATTTGKYGDGNYYLRITQNGNPDAGDTIELNNGAGTFDEREIVDAGFLELVRLGIKPADDPLIAKSLRVIDEVIKVDTPNGPAFYRYNNDGYGEMDDGRRWNWDGKYTGKGRLWVLLSGERGQYELALASLKTPQPIEQSADGVPVTTQKNLDRLAAYHYYSKAAKIRLDNMLAFANDGLMIPEQVWDKKKTPSNVDKQFIPELKFGEGTGSATPLAWSMAQFIRLAINLKAGKNLDTPDVVYERYKNGIPPQVTNFGGTDGEFLIGAPAGEKVKFDREAQPGTRHAYRLGEASESRMLIANEKGKIPVEFIAPEGEIKAVAGIQAPDGATSFERVTLRSEPKAREISAELIERIKASKSSPLIDGGKAIVFYRGEARGVTLAGDITSWNPTRIHLQRIADGLWATQLDLKPTARTEYQLIVDGKWMLDPLNTFTNDNGVGGRNSVLAMPGYVSTAWYKERNNPPAKEVAELEIDSEKYGKRTVKVYLPMEYYNRGIAPKLPVLYFLDGSEYISRARAIDVLENLIAARKVEPFMLVFTDPKERMKEYWASDDFADYIANDVVPAVEAKYFSVVKTGRENRGVIGASLGGVSSLWIGVRHPQKFSRLGAQSPSFWVDNERTTKALERLDPAKYSFKFFLDDGVFEGVDDTRRVNVMLRGKGFSVTYVEGQTGHNWTAWRDRLADAFIALMK